MFDISQMMTLVKEFDLDKLGEMPKPDKVNLAYKLDTKDGSTLLQLNVQIFPANEVLADLIVKAIKVAGSSKETTVTVTRVK